VGLHQGAAAQPRADAHTPIAFRRRRDIKVRTERPLRITHARRRIEKGRKTLAHVNPLVLFADQHGQGRRSICRMSRRPASHQTTKHLPASSVDRGESEADKRPPGTALTASGGLGNVEDPLRRGVTYDHCKSSRRAGQR
jgi:hypothetical protein